MKRTVLVVTATLVFVALTFTALGGISATESTEPTLNATSSAPEAAKLAAVLNETDTALYARLSQLVQLNRVFDDCFDSDTVLVDEASVILLDSAETLENGDRVIKQSYIISFIYDLYGKVIDPLSLPSVYTAGAPAGYFHIIPRGYDEMESEIISLSVGQDGQITAAVKLTVRSHWGEASEAQATFTFVQNTKSAFGYNLLKAEVTAPEAQTPSTQPDLAADLAGPALSY
ncbi:MAG: hypothetical protein ACOYKJ_06505 [Candidatus Howiella sp.]|jgi:hypothetical protein